MSRSNDSITNSNSTPLIFRRITKKLTAEEVVVKYNTNSKDTVVTYKFNPNEAVATNKFNPKEAMAKHNITPQEAVVKHSITPKEAVAKHNFTPLGAVATHDINPKNAVAKHSIKPKKVKYKINSRSQNATQKINDVFTKKQEILLKDHLLEFCKTQYELSNTTMRKTAYKYATMLPDNVCPQKWKQQEMASFEWLSKFKSRYPVLKKALINKLKHQCVCIMGCHMGPEGIEVLEQLKAKILIVRVFHYLQKEYEYIQSANDLGHLVNVLRRTAEATGVCEQTITNILEEEKAVLTDFMQSVPNILVESESKKKNSKKKETEKEYLDEMDYVNGVERTNSTTNGINPNANVDKGTKSVEIEPSAVIDNSSHICDDPKEVSKELRHSKDVSEDSSRVQDRCSRIGNGSSDENPSVIDENVIVIDDDDDDDVGKSASVVCIGESAIVIDDDDVIGESAGVGGTLLTRKNHFPKRPLPKTPTSQNTQLVQLIRNKTKKGVCWRLSEMGGTGASVVGESVIAIVDNGEETCSVISQSAGVVGERAGVVGKNAIVIDNNVVGESASVVGESAGVVGETARVVGESTTSVGESASVIGGSASVVDESACVVGEMTTVVSESASVVGESASAVGESASIVGETASVVDETATVVGVCVVDEGVTVVPKVPTNENTTAVKVDTVDEDVKINTDNICSLDFERLQQDPTSIQSVQVEMLDEEHDELEDPDDRPLVVDTDAMETYEYDEQYADYKSDGHSNEIKDCDLIKQEDSTNYKRIRIEFAEDEPITPNSSPYTDDENKDIKPLINTVLNGTDGPNNKRMRIEFADDEDETTKIYGIHDNKIKRKVSDEPEENTPTSYRDMYESLNSEKRRQIAIDKLMVLFPERDSPTKHRCHPMLEKKTDDSHKELKNTLSDDEKIEKERSRKNSEEFKPYREKKKVAAPTMSGPSDSDREAERKRRNRENVRRCREKKKNKISALSTSHSDSNIQTKKETRKQKKREYNK